MIASICTCIVQFELSKYSGFFDVLLQADKRIADMKLAKDFAATMEEFRKLQSLAIQRETAYKPVAPQNAQSK